GEADPDERRRGPHPHAHGLELAHRRRPGQVGRSRGLRDEGPDRGRADRRDRRDLRAVLASSLPWGPMVSFLAVVQVLLVFGLIALVLMHSGRDAGMGGMGFTPASQGGTHIVERNLTRYTLVLAVLFFANCVALFHYLK